MEIDLINKTGVITLKSDHSMFTGNKPKIISNDMYTAIIPTLARDTNKEAIEALGLFESATPNYTTYYPDVTADDLMPKDEDFIFPIFRCLSATTVWKGYRPIDFSKNGVLKAAMNMLIGQTINADHETALGNGMGVVKSVSWQDSYTVDGVKIPAGINGEFMIDGKSNPRIARAIMCKPPIIHSNSVSVRFEWEPSHKLNSDEDFYSKLGTKDDKGNLYRLVVNKIVQFSETSLVPHGADPYAQIVTDGKINNPTYAAGVYNFSAKDTKGNEMGLSHFIDYKSDLTLGTIPLELNKDNNKNQKQESMEILRKLEAALGMDVNSLEGADQAKLSEAITNFTDSKVTLSTEDIQTKLDLATTEKEALETEKANLTIEVDALKLKEVDADKYAATLTAKRTEASRLYGLSKGDDSKPEILAMLESCDEVVLESLTKEYQEALDAKFPLKCTSCGEVHTLSRGSQEEEGNGNTKPQTRTALREDLRKTSRENNKFN